MPPSENPKLIRALKDGKAPLEYLVDSVMDGDAWVHKGGADKYGVRNWLIDKIKASTYKGAIRRHFKAWSEGEDVDPDSGWSPLYHIRASCAILLDAKKHGTLIDDRDFCESLSAKNETLEKSDAAPVTSWVSPTELSLDHPHCVCFNDLDAGRTYSGPFPDWWRADEYARANPHNIAGRVSIHTLNRP